MIFSMLPLELRYYIIEYVGIMKLRNGKYMNQITKDDPRYIMLDTRPEPKICNTSNGGFWFSVIFSVKRQHKHICIHYNRAKRIITYQYYYILDLPSGNMHPLQIMNAY